VPAIGEAYTSSNFGDDLCIAAMTTNQSKYYADAYRFYQSFALSGSQEVWNWDSRVPAIYVLFVEAAIARPGLAQGAGLNVNLTGWQAESEAYFDRIVDGNVKTGYLTKGALFQDLMKTTDVDRGLAVLRWRL
jgi:endoglucanase